VNYSRSVSTGGVGGVYQGGNVDALRSQDSIVVNGQRLYNVNPGSNTVSMFEINSSDPTQIHQVGRSVNSGGDFPVSVAVSSKSGNVCTLNGGRRAGIQCFRATANGLVQIANSNRAVQLSQTTPPGSGSSSFGASTILFSPDGSKLVIDVKGLSQSGVPGYLAVWNVNSDGSLSQNHQTFPAPTHAGQQNFGMTYLHGKEGYVLADGSQGGLVYDFSKGYGPQATAKNIMIPGIVITCWASYASKSNTYFITDAGTNIISELSIDNASLNTTLVHQYHLPQAAAPLDSAVGNLGNNQYLYQLAVTSFSIYVFDVQSAGNSQLIQSYNFTQGLTNDKVPFSSTLQGLAFYAVGN